MNEVVVNSNVNLDVTKAVRDAFGLLKDNLVLLIVSSLIASILSCACLGLLVGPMMMGMFLICDRLVSGDAAKPTIGDLFKGFSFFVPGLVLALFAGLGSVACGVGALVTMPVAMLGMFRVIDKGVSLGEAISFGFSAIFKQKQWMFIVLMIVASILAQLGVFLCVIGVFVTMPLYYLVLACGYRQIFPKA